MALTLKSLKALKAAAEASFQRDVSRLSQVRVLIDANVQEMTEISREKVGDPVSMSQWETWADRKRQSLRKENEALASDLEKLIEVTRISAGRRDAVDALIEKTRLEHQRRLEAREEERTALLTMQPSPRR